MQRLTALLAHLPPYRTGQTKDLAEKLAQTRRSAQNRSVTTQPISKGTTSSSSAAPAGISSLDADGKGGAGGSSKGGGDGGGGGGGSSASQQPAGGTNDEEAAIKMASEVRKREDETPLNKVVRDG